MAGLLHLTKWEKLSKVQSIGHEQKFTLPGLDKNVLSKKDLSSVHTLSVVDS